MKKETIKINFHFFNFLSQDEKKLSQDEKKTGADNLKSASESFNFIPFKNACCLFKTMTLSLLENT